MKKNIRGLMYNTVNSSRVYNTDNSKRIGVRCGEPVNGHLMAETLYKARDGQYFLCESDILSKNTSSGKITPITAKDANEWAKKNLGEYTYAAEFGPPAHPGKNNTPKILSISLPPDLIQKLEQIRTEQGKNISQIIESILRKELI
jgi:hypothetical protein